MLIYFSVCTVAAEERGQGGTIPPEIQGNRVKKFLLLQSHNGNAPPLPRPLLSPTFRDYAMDRWMGE